MIQSELLPLVRRGTTLLLLLVGLVGTETAAINTPASDKKWACNCETGKRLSEAESENNVIDQYGFTRGELPIRKIYVDGRPVYVRQVVVGPPHGHLRYSTATVTNTTAAETLFWKERASTDGQSSSNSSATSITVRLLRKLSRREAGISSGDAFSELLADDLQCFNEASSLSQTIRNKRWAFAIPCLTAPVASAAAAAPAPAYSFGYAPAAAQQYYSSQQPSAPVAQNLLVQPPPPALSPLPEQPLPPAAEYPLPECYTDESNFMCCSNGLERAMHQAFQELVEAGVNVCNIQHYTNHIQKIVENKFNTPFEVVNGIGDFASKSHFYHNLICKIELHGRFLLAYATPKKEVDEPVDENSASYTLPNQKPQYLVGQQPSLRQRRLNHVYRWKK